ncbi:MAG: dicarboxylate/amino acid:cation symporter [Kiritimatiellae bacterium]|nr:dicarboxylate/amino acid:cation symporter [Kiritimatiellia bacterium]
MNCRNKTCRIPIVWRILIGFILGIFLGIAAPKIFGEDSTKAILAYVSPFGSVLVSMLKMVVYPIIFFSLILGAASLPLKKSGRVGGAVLVWYFVTSLFATVFGVIMAFLMNPSIRAAKDTASQYLASANEMAGNSGAATFGDFFVNLFQNPFASLSHGQFLPIIIFSILFGFAARCLLDELGEDGEDKSEIKLLIRVCDGAQKVAFKLIDWVMLYFPIGVFALTFSNFAEHGILLFGPYVRIVVCVMVGVLAMILVIYPLAISFFCHENPYRVLLRIRQPILTAFVTRSSAATLPVSFNAMNEIGVSKTLSSFSLPLGATINMDGVCVHLPVFVILAANMFGVHLTAVQMVVLVTSIMFASVGAGGVPGGSVFLLFMVLENMGLAGDQVAMIVALALGINPILDMFETCCNVTGDNVCTYIVACKNGLIEEK